MAHFSAVHKASIFSGGEPSQAMEEVTVPLARWLAHHALYYTAPFQPWVEGHLAPGARQWKASGWSESSAHQETAGVQHPQHVRGGAASWALNRLSHISNCPREGCHASVSLILLGSTLKFHNLGLTSSFQVCPTGGASCSEACSCLLHTTWPCCSLCQGKNSGVHCHVHNYVSSVDTLGWGNPAWKGYSSVEQQKVTFSTQEIKSFSFIGTNQTRSLWGKTDYWKNTGDGISSFTPNPLSTLRMICPFKNNVICLLQNIYFHKLISYIPWYGEKLGFYK